MNSKLLIFGVCVVLTVGGISCSENPLLKGLAESDFSALASLIRKASVMGALENAMHRHNVTILAPQDEWFRGDGGKTFRRFLIEEGNEGILRRAIEFHVVPRRKITADEWPVSSVSLKALSTDPLMLWTANNGDLKVGFAVNVVAPDALVFTNAVVHGIDSFLVPKIVQDAYQAWRKSQPLS